MPSTSFSGVECTSSGLMKTSVEAHQQVTSRETFFVLRNSQCRLSVAGPARTCSSLFDISSVEPLYVFAVKRRFHRLDGFQEGLHFLQVLIIQHAGFFRGLVRIILEKIPASENQVIEVCQPEPTS